jgi:hypothetical protein
MFCKCQHYKHKWADINIFFRVQEHGGETILPFSCAFEQKLVDMPEDEAAKYCAENQLTRQVNSP